MTADLTFFAAGCAASDAGDFTAHAWVTTDDRGRVVARVAGRRRRADGSWHRMRPISVPVTRGRSLDAAIGSAILLLKTRCLRAWRRDGGRT